jgi:hypothetical protein
MTNQECLDEQKRCGKDPSRGRNYRKITFNEICGDGIPCWKCAHSRKRERGGRYECDLNNGSVVGTIYTCDTAVKA